MIAFCSYFTLPTFAVLSTILGCRHVGFDLEKRAYPSAVQPTIALSFDHLNDFYKKTKRGEGFVKNRNFPLPLFSFLFFFFSLSSLKRGIGIGIGRGEGEYAQNCVQSCAQCCEQSCVQCCVQNCGSPRCIQTLCYFHFRKQLLDKSRFLMSGTEKQKHIEWI